MMSSFFFLFDRILGARAELGKQQSLSEIF